MLAFGQSKDSAEKRLAESGVAIESRNYVVRHSKRRRQLTRSFVLVDFSWHNGATKERRTKSEVTSEGARELLHQPTIENAPFYATPRMLLPAVGKSEGVGEAEERRAKSGVAGEAGGAVARSGATDAAAVPGGEPVDPKQSEQSKRAIHLLQEAMCLIYGCK